ncbi:MAG: hypothetical protein R6V07_20335 [Armatimonadota bacterium]
MSTRIDQGQSASADLQVLLPGSASECRYRRRLAGVDVCWAARTVSIVTDADCDRCRVPPILDRVDCYHLGASVESVREQKIAWICGATGESINSRILPDCSYCQSCERSVPCRPVIEQGG